MPLDVGLLGVRPGSAAKMERNSEHIERHQIAREFSLATVSGWGNATIIFRAPTAKNLATSGLNKGDSLHLHVHSFEKYDTGDLAYNFVKRGFKHGIRIVGTLKSEPDMNVLAIYEK